MNLIFGEVAFCQLRRAQRLKTCAIRSSETAVSQRLRGIDGLDQSDL